MDKIISFLLFRVADQILYQICSMDGPLYVLRSHLRASKTQIGEAIELLKNPLFSTKRKLNSLFT